MNRIAVAVALAGAALGVVAALVRPPLALPVAADLGGLGGQLRVPIAVVAGRVALVVPAVLAAVGLALGPRLPAGAARRLLPVGLAAPITVFLVAQLNGIEDLGALVLGYATTAGVVLIRALPGPRAWSTAAMLGIVPWGVVAFHEIGAGLAGGAIPAGVRVLTVLVLAGQVAEFVRRRDLRPAPLLVAAPAALLAAGSLLV